MIKIDLLIEQLNNLEITGTVTGIAFESSMRTSAVNCHYRAKGDGFVRIDWDSEPLPDDIDIINAIIDAHNPSSLSTQEVYEQNKSLVLRRLRDSALADMSPDEIYNVVQNRISGWTTLAQAKSDLAEWMPVLWAVVMWIVRNNDS